MIFKTLFAIFIDTLGPFLPRLLKKTPKTFANNALSLTVLFFFDYKLNNRQLVFYYFQKLSA